jgi:23S rRNA (cytosine1962-C5)-methyltransferase
VAEERLGTEFYLWAESAAFHFKRVFVRYMPIRNSEREAPRLLSGDTDENLRTVAIERSLHYGIDFAAGYSVGLFVDQRENRHLIRRVAPKKLLNCFAYTCSFSVAAATVDAKTVSIDLSKKSLARGKENFALNSLATIGHQFIADDVLDVLPYLARKREKFDMIILDPPTFSRSRRGKAFQVERDFEALLLAALEVAERDARILLSTNCTDLDAQGLELMARFCLKTTRRAGAYQQEPALPDVPANTGARTVWLTLR